MAAHRDPETAPSAMRPLVFTVIAATLCRVVLNTARRFAYPFAPVLSRGLGVELTAVTTLIAANQVTGVLGMFFGPLADRFGHRRVMFAGMGMLIAGMLAAALLPYYGVVLVSLFLAGLGKNVFDPALQAFAGDRIAYRRRGFIIGILEFSWAASTLVGIPLIGVLIDRFGWRAPFFAIAASGLIGTLILIRALSGAEPAARPVRPRSGFLKDSWRLCLRPWALGAVGFSFFISMANDTLFVVCGVWLEETFQLSIVALGIGTGLIGAAELAGEILTASAADRFGLKRSVVTGGCLSLLSYFILPAAGSHLGAALTGLFVVFVVYEFMIVSFLSLCTELVPEMRATLMATVLAAGGIGRMAGALMGGPLWLAGGMAAIATASAVASALAVVLLGWGLRRWQPA
jgi:DHA1 family inner membrane transport protein